MADNEGFSKDICRSMVAMLDVDHSGKLGIDEFKKLMLDIAKWRTVFKSYDHDGSGKFNTFELRAALEASGYKLSNHVLNALVHRYGSRDGLIAFDDFIMCAVKIKTMIGKCFKSPSQACVCVCTCTTTRSVQCGVYAMHRPHTVDTGQGLFGLLQRSVRHVSYRRVLLRLIFYRLAFAKWI